MNYGILKIEGQNFVPLEHAAWLSHVPAPFLAKVVRSGDLSFREIKGRLYIAESSLGDFIAKRALKMALPVAHQGPPPDPLEIRGDVLGGQAALQIIGATAPVMDSRGPLGSNTAMSIAAAAHAAGLSENYIGKLVRSGEISSVVSDGELRIPEDSLNVFIARHTKRLADRSARLAQERAAVFSKITDGTHIRSAIHSAIQNVRPHLVPISRRSELLRQLSVLVIAFVIGGGIYTLAHMSPRTTALTNGAQRMVAAASETAGGFSSSVFADLARAVNTDVNSLFYALVGRPTTVATVAVDANAVQTTPIAAPVSRAPVYAASTAGTAVSAPAPVINQTIVQQPVIERIVEARTVFAGVSQQSLDEQLQQLDNKLSSRMYGLTSANTASIVQDYHVTSQTNAINMLNGTRITSPTISGGSISDTDITARNLSASGSVTFGDIVFTNATSTNLAVTGATSLGSVAVSGDLTLTGALNFSGSSSTISANGGTFTNATSTNAYFTNFTAASATTTGDHYIGGNLTVGGNSITLGTSTSNTLAINSSISSHLIPNQNVTYDLGSASYYWRNAYVGTLNANNISAASSSIGGTNSQTFTINAGNATADTQDMNLVFFRGTVVPNAVISWNSALNAKRFEFNQPIYVSNQSGSTTQATLSLKGVAGQTGNLFAIASSSGSNMFTIGSDGSVTISTSTITALTSGTTTVTNLSSTGLATSTFAGSLSVGGNFNFNGAILQNGTAFTSSQWITSGSNIYYTTGRVGIGNAAPSYLFDVSGTGHFAGTVDADHFVATSSSATTLFNGNLTVNGNTLLSNATSTNLFSTTASSTNLFAANASIGTLSLIGGFVSQASSTVVGNFTSTGTVSGSSFVGAGTGLTGTAVSFSIGGNAGTATALQTARAINGTNFNGSADITITAASSTLLANNNTFSGTNSFTGNTTLANATSTNFFSTTASSTNLFSQLAGVGTLTLGNKLTVANGGTGVGTLTGVAIGNGTSAFTAGSAQTCTNQFVRAMSATYVATCATVNLSTDIIGTLAVANGGTGITSFGTGIATFLGTPTSANLAAALTDETGTGSVVFSAGPTLSGQVSITNATDYSFVMAHTGTNGNSWSISNLAGAGNAGGIRFYNNTNSAEYLRITNAGNIGIGTTTPWRKLSVVDTVANAQLAVSYDTTRTTQFQTDSSGDLHVNPSGGDVQQDDSNLWVCSGGSCPAGAPSGTGNLIVENKVGVGTSTPTDALSVQGLLRVGANSNAVVTMGTATSTFNGDVKILGKLDVATIDPVYMVDNVKYATYGASTIGIHEEVVSQITPAEWDAAKQMYVYTIDFDHLDKGSDLWLFHQITDFGPTWQNLVVTLTPGFDGRTYYEQHLAHNQLRVYSSKKGPVSLRMIANRYDFSKWPNLRPDQDGNAAGAHVIDTASQSATAAKAIAK